MEMILASKPGMPNREFTKAAWERMGEQRSGWRALPAEAQKKNAEAKKTSVPQVPSNPKAETGVVKTEGGIPEVPKVETVAELKKKLEEAEKRENVNTPEEVKETQKTDTPPIVGDVQKSTDGNVIAAVEHINKLGTVDEIEAYIAGDDRSTVAAGAAKRIDILKS